MATTSETSQARKRRRLKAADLSDKLMEALSATSLFSYIPTRDRFRMCAAHSSLARLEARWTEAEFTCRCLGRYLWQGRKFVRMLPTALNVFMTFPTTESGLRGVIKLVDFSSLLKLITGGVSVKVLQLDPNRARVSRSLASPSSDSWQLACASVYPQTLPPYSKPDSERFLDFLQSAPFRALLTAIFPNATVTVRQPPGGLRLGNPGHGTCDYGEICVRDQDHNLEWRCCAYKWHDVIYQIVRHAKEAEVRHEREKDRKRALEEMGRVLAVRLEERRRVLAVLQTLEESISETSEGTSEETSEGTSEETSDIFMP